MTDRFSRLNQEVLEAFSRGSNPESLAADDPTRLYWEWKTFKRPADRKLDSSSTRRNREPKSVIIAPIFNPSGAAKVRVSKRAGEWAIATTGLIPALNWLATSESASVIRGFEPAKLIVRTGAANETRDQRSRITKKLYKTKFQSSDQGYVVPFGANPGGAGVVNNFSAISGTIKANAAIAALASVSFRNEIIPTDPEFLTYTGATSSTNPDT